MGELKDLMLIPKKLKKRKIYGRKKNCIHEENREYKTLVFFAQKKDEKLKKNTMSILWV
jgi:hypothetical protein